MSGIKRERDLEFLISYLKGNKAMGASEISKILNWSPKFKKENRKLLEEWESEGYIMQVRGGRYTVPEKLGYACGRLEIVKNKFGFVDTAEEGIFVPKSKFGGALSGDTVMVNIIKGGDSGKKKEGEVVRVIKREQDRVIGIFQKSVNFGFVIPTQSFGKDIFIPRNHINNAKDGELVLVEIYSWGGEDKKPEGKVLEILGDPYNTDVMLEALIKRSGFSEDFPTEVKKELAKIEKQISKEELSGRTDLRDLSIVTIDGEDAKDLDDAVYVEKLNNGNYRLVVSIADVAHYIKEKSQLDQEAQKRGNSVYLVDRVIPMFPKEISNGTCSLNPREDKLTFTCDMEIDSHGRVVDHDTYKSVIKSVERMTYTDVNKILEGDKELTERYSHIKDMFFDMLELSKILRKHKYERGSIDFDLPEVKVVLGETKKVKYLAIRDRGESERIIEDFMIAANETVAEKIFWMEIPFVYRTHEKPDADRIKLLNESLEKFGYRIHNFEELHPGKFQKIIEESKERGINTLVHKLILMSLKQARYTEENIGHFGLASNYYTHFTSPIRRYSDLMVHRILGETLQGYPSQKRLKNLSVTLPKICIHISKTERDAMKAEEESKRIKIVEYMLDKIGEVYNARITGMNRNGIFFETEEHVECFFNVISAEGYYEFDDKHYKMVERDTRTQYDIGQQMKVMIVRADLNELEVEVIPYEGD